MPLHLQKLCVGVDTVEGLADWLAADLKERERLGMVVEDIHTTRMMPKRIDDLLDGGSLYWVIRGVMQVRQRLLDVRAIRDAEGVSRCELVLEPKLVRVEPLPRRPFQGWRYLEPASAPRDLGAGGDGGALPTHLVRELRELGLM